jgi:hypothetical protein
VAASREIRIESLQGELQFERESRAATVSDAAERLEGSSQSITGEVRLLSESVRTYSRAVLLALGVLVFFVFLSVLLMSMVRGQSAADASFYARDL